MGISTLFVLICGLLVFAAIQKLHHFILVGLFAALAVMSPLHYLDTLSKPKDITREYFANVQEASVINYYVIPGKALYIMLKFEGASEGRYYKMDWSEEARKRAQELQDAFEGSGGAIIKNPFEKSLETEDNFSIYPLPQPKREVKEKPKVVPQFNL